MTIVRRRDRSIYPHLEIRLQTLHFHPITNVINLFKIVPDERGCDLYLARISLFVVAIDMLTAYVLVPLSA